MRKNKVTEVKRFLLENGGWELVSEYTGFHDTITIKKDGYLSATSFCSFKSGHKPIIFGVKNKYFKDNIKLFLQRKDKNITFVDAFLCYKSGKSRIEVHMLDALGHKFIRTWEHIYGDKGVLCCPRCSRKLQTTNHREKMYDKWYSLIDKNIYNILEEPSYITANSRVLIEEKETGYRYDAYIRAFEKDFNGQAFNAFSNKRFYLYNLQKYAENNNLRSIPIEIIDTSKSHNLIKFRCECGEEFNRSIHKWMDGRDLCPSCANVYSLHERKVHDFLEDNGVKHIQEFRYNSCRDIKPLPFDFYLCDYNALIEIDGEQHYAPVLFGGEKHNIYNRFILQQKHDNIKTEFCNNNNIPLLRIPYFDFSSEKWEEDILNFIKPLRSNDS